MHIYTWAKEWLGRSLRRKLLLLSISTLLLFLSLLGYLSYRAGQAVVRSEVGQRNSQLATLVAQDINAQFQNIWRTVRLLLFQLEGSSQALALQAQAMLEIRRASPLTYRALYLLDDKAEVILHLEDSLDKLLEIENVQEIIDRPPVPLTERLSTAYQEALQGGIYISPAFITGADQVPNIIMGIPLIGEDGRPQQVMVAQIDLRDIWRNVDEIRIGRTGRAFVVSEDGTIIAHPNRVYIGQTLPEALKDVTAGYEGRAQYTDPLSGQLMLAAYSPVGGQSDWGIVVEQEQAEALQPINVIAFVTLVVLLAALGLATVVTIFTARSITRPIQHLAEATQSLAHTGDLSTDIPVEGQDEVGQLAETFNQMTAGLREARNRLLAAQAVAQELRVAREIQLSLLPEAPPLIHGLEVTASCLPAQEVGGDFYGYYPLPSDPATSIDGFAVAVGDVSGKGTPAALYMAVSTSALAAKVQMTDNGVNLCNELNALLHPRVKASRMNIALLYVNFTRQNGCSDRGTYEAHIVNAGLIAPLVRQTDRCEYVDIGGLPLGVMPEANYQQVALCLEPGDYLVMCSDGVVEAMNLKREMYGFERLQERVSAFPADPPHNLVDWILKDVEAFLAGAEPHDDMTIVVIRLRDE